VRLHRIQLSVRTSVYFLSALWLVMVPGLCAGSPPLEAPVSMSFLHESDVMAVAVKLLEFSAEANSSELSHSDGPLFSANQEDEPAQATDENTSSTSSEPEESTKSIADPLEPVNRAFFHFNDKLYFWILKPVATGYKAVIPEDGRLGVRNFFSNLSTPIRLVNCLLQAKFKGAGNETVRFIVNSTLGLAGFFDPAKKDFKIEKQEADFGQTLGIWGMGPIFYIDLPLLGPSSLRDGLGYAVDTSLNPQVYLAFYSVIVGYANTGGWILDKVNETSLTLGEYESLKKAALDPYIAVRDAYHQYRQNKVKR